jgi:hypothetical protein
MARVTEEFQDIQARKNHLFNPGELRRHWEEQQPGWRAPTELVRHYKNEEDLTTELKPARLQDNTPKGMKYVNYVNVGVREAMTFERVEIGGNIFFGVVQFDPSHPFVDRLKDLIVCLTPKRRPMAIDRETALEEKFMKMELSHPSAPSVKEFMEDTSTRVGSYPKWYQLGYPPEGSPDDDDDDAAAGAGAGAMV